MKMEKTISEEKEESYQVKDILKNGRNIKLIVNVESLKLDCLNKPPLILILIYHHLI